MTASALTLQVLFSALLHASWNALVKRERDPQNATVGVLLLAALIAGAAALLTRQGLGTPRGHLFAVASGMTEAGYVFSLARALHHGSLGRVYAIGRGGALVLVWPISVLWLGELATPIALTGAGLVVLGLLLSGARTAEPRGSDKAGAVGWALVSAVCIAGYNLLYKRALREGAAPHALFATSIGIAIAFNLALAGRGREGIFRFVRERLWVAALGGLIAFGSFGVFLWCLQSGGAGALVTLRNTSIVFTQGLALLIGERPSRAQLSASVLITGGAVLLAWPA